ncbi:hypothetical protein DFH27DRAFT_189191 [Peziza echinospora]|nr:hypothetical protein DFH27DRAFT_189191 [Peziza echinospora]
MNTRSSLRTRRSAETASPALADTPTQKPKRTKVLNKLNQDSSKLNSDNNNSDNTNTIESFLGTAPSKVTYPNLALHKALDTTFDLYPSLENAGTPSKKRHAKAGATAGRSSTVRRSASRRSLMGQDTEMVTPSKSNEEFVPKSSTFDFKFSSGLEEVGRRIMEELKLSSVAVQAKILEDGHPDAPVTNSQPSSSAAGPTATRGRRFSDAHKQQFNKMSSIADHYAAKRAKGQAAASGTNVFGAPKTPKNLKRKGRAEELASPMKLSPSKASITSDGEPELDDSPIPASKKTKFDGTPYTKKTGGLLQPGTPFLPGAIHGISRSVSVKEAAKKQSGLPRLVRKDGHPATPSKPVAVATPIKEATLLASPSKHRPPGTSMKNNEPVTQPGTPSPVKSSKPSVKWADLSEPATNLEPRMLFDGVVVEASSQAKRKTLKSSEDEASEEEDFSTATTPASKRVRMMPVSFSFYISHTHKYIHPANTIYQCYRSLAHQ